MKCTRDSYLYYQFGNSVYLEMRVINQYFVSKIPRIKFNNLIKQVVIRAQPSLPFPRISGNYSEFFLESPLDVVHVDSEKGLLESMLDYNSH